MKVVFTDQFKKDMAKMGLDDSMYQPTQLERIQWKLEAIWEKITNIPDQIKYFFQRARKGYAVSDVWGMDHYLMKVIPDMLRTLANDKSMIKGHPVYRHIKSRRDWEKILRQMAKDIEAGEKAWDLCSSKTVQKNSLKRFNRGMKNLHKYWFNLWD